MQKKFLGKKVPSAEKMAEKPKKRPTFSWLVLIVAPLIVMGSSIYIWQLQKKASLINFSATIQGADRLLAKGQLPPAVSSSGDNNKPCGPTYVDTNFHPFEIFPIIPPQIQATTYLKDSSEKPVLDAYKHPVLDVSKSCTSAYWNLLIVWIMTYKMLALLNWLAGVIAVILTVYAGLLYISGFANENNVKTAKNILKACYTGLIIVVFSRLILYGTIQTLTGKNPSANGVDSTDIIPTQSQ